MEPKGSDQNGQGSGRQESFVVKAAESPGTATLLLYSTDESAKAEHQSRIQSLLLPTDAAGTSDGTILKPFLIKGGRFIVEADISNLETVMFSIRGVINSKNIPEVFQAAEDFLKKTISDNGHSGN
ncbi:hypothetical protein [Sporomusa sp.]|uniref:hypothetical protein n=1 Tax=Sporomusa sp. TaxID=2078658 RepID=UPI002C8FFE54|nr:hypothetical protein [Sporomusa sp.]HWR07784.1 hypothetical protein [Sporomusa sp.]